MKKSVVIAVLLISFVTVSLSSAEESREVKESDISKTRENNLSHITKADNNRPEVEESDKNSETYSASENSEDPVQGFKYMVIAYMLFWGVIVSSLFLLWRKQRRMDNELTDLREFLKLEKKNRS